MAEKSSHSLGWENEDEIKKFPTHANIFVLLEFIPKDSRMVAYFQLDEFCSVLRMPSWLQPLVDVPGCVFESKASDSRIFAFHFTSEIHLNP